jgi:hypothetical protein
MCLCTGLYDPRKSKVPPKHLLMSGFGTIEKIKQALS